MILFQRFVSPSILSLLFINCVICFFGIESIICAYADLNIRLFAIMVCRNNRLLVTTEALLDYLKIEVVKHKKYLNSMDVRNAYWSKSY